MTDNERAYWIERCLRLEAELLIARGEPITPPLPKIARRSLPAAPQFGQTYRRVTPDDSAQMRALRAANTSYRVIAQRCGFSEGTAWRYTMDVRDEREVGG